MAEKLISFDDEKSGLGLPDVVEDKLSETYALKGEVPTGVVKSVNGAEPDDTGALTITTGNPDAITSPQISRILASLDHQTPLNDGDLLLKLVNQTVFFTDFSEYPLDQFPADWTPRWKIGQWLKVVADPSATGGVVLREEDVPSSGTNRALSWDRVGTPTNVEIVFKWCVSEARVPQRAILRGAGETIPTGYHGGSQNSSTSSLQAAVNSTSSTTLQEATRSFDDNVWYITRMRAVGSTISVKTWDANEPEPTAWEFEVEDTSIPEPGWVGVRTFGNSGIRLFDWVGVALDGGTAPMQAVTL